MDAIIATGSVPLLQADGPPATGTPQYATGGNPDPANLLPPTLIPPYHYNGIVQEILTLQQGAGLVNSRNDLTQVLQAVQILGKRYSGGGLNFVNTNATLGLGRIGTVICSADAGGFTVTLPLANVLPNGFVYYELIRRDGAAQNAINVVLPAGNVFFGTADNSTTTDLRPGERLLLRADGVNSWVALRTGCSDVYAFDNPDNNTTDANAYTPRVGCLLHDISVTGGGGGGGSGPLSQPGSGAGGGGGITVKGKMVLQQGYKYPLAVGKGGNGDAVSGSQGARGGTSGFSSDITATGGYGGQGADTYPLNYGGAGAGSTVDPNGIANAYSASAFVMGLEVLAGETGGDGSAVAGAATGYGGAAGGAVGFGQRAFSGQTGGGTGGYGGGGAGAYSRSNQGGSGGNGGPGLVTVKPR